MADTASNSFGFPYLTPLVVDEFPSESLCQDVKGSRFATTPVPDNIRFLNTLPSPVRVSSPMVSVCVSPAHSPVVAVSPAPHAVDQITALQSRCRMTEQQHQEAKSKAEALELEVQTLRKKLELFEGDAETHALWKAVMASSRDGQVLQELRAKDTAWLAQERTSLEDRRRTEIWRSLRDALSPAQISDVARTVGGNPLDVGMLLFDNTNRERRRTHSSGREVSAPQISATVQTRSQVRSMSRSSFPSTTSQQPRLPPRAPQQQQQLQPQQHQGSQSNTPHVATIVGGAAVRSSSIRDRIAHFESNNQAHSR